MKRRKFFGALTLLAFLSSVQAPLPAQEVETEAKSDSQLISLDFESITLKQLLKIFSQQSGLNFVASSDVEAKTVTVYFENVTVKDALESLMAAHNLEYYQAEDSNIFIVYPIGASSQRLQTKVFFLKYTRLSTSPLDVGGQKTISDLMKSVELGSEDSSSEDQVELVLSPKSTVQKGIDQLVASLLSDQGRVTVDINTNSLIVTDAPDRLRQITQVVEKLDIPTPQVLMEVYLMEVKKDLLKDLGVEWGGSNGSLFTFTAGTRTTGFPFTENFISRRFQTPNRFSTGDAEDAPNTAQESLELGSFNAENFTATLHMITSDNDTKILARPKLVTLNNEAATIKLVTDAAIANTATTTTAEGTAVTSANQAERTEVGINLKLTPQINEDNSVALFVEPTVTTVAPSSFFSTVFLDPTRRTVRTLVRVKNHETLVIGGLLDSSETSVKKGVPGLKNIPFLGHAFRYDNIDGTDRELIIFITPHIIRPGEVSEREAYVKDLAVKRVLDQFMEREIDRSMDALLNSKTLTPSNAKSSVPPAVRDKQMTQALNEIDPKTVKWNR